MNNEYSRLYRKSFTFDERKKIEELIKQELNYPQIGKILNRSRWSIKGEVNSKGGYLTYTAVKAQEIADSHSVYINNVKNRRIKPYTNEDRIVIEESIKKGLTFAQIGVLLTRTFASIANEIIKNGHRIGYTAKKSQERYEKSLISRREKGMLPISEDKIQIILALIAQDASLSEIRIRTGLTYERLTRWLAYNAPQVKLANEKKVSLSDRVDALQAQIDIILDILNQKGTNRD